MRSIASVLLSVLAVLVLAGIGVAIYNAGLQQGLAQSAQLPAGTVPYAYGYGYGFHGFGFGGLFGLIIPILFLFLIFGLLRAAFRGGRGWGHGYGRWGGGPSMGAGGGDAWFADRDSHIAELHRRLHATEAGQGGTSSGGPAAGSAAGDIPPAR